MALTAEPWCVGAVRALVARDRYGDGGRTPCEPGIEAIEGNSGEEGGDDEVVWRLDDLDVRGWSGWEGGIRIYKRDGTVEDIDG